MTFKNKIRAGICLGGVSALFGCSGVDGSNGTSRAPVAHTVSAVMLSAAAEKQDYLNNYARPDAIQYSFHAHEGMWVDCVDVNRQPSMLTPLMAGKSIAQPPPLPAQPALPAGHQWAHQDVEDHANEIDENGHVRHCGPGQIPMRRTTAEDLKPFATLHDFFAKGPDRAALGAALNPNYQAPPSVAGYEYARETQFVTNWGFQSFINLWQPYLQSAADHSISQIWVAVLNGGATQSAEAGWIAGAPFANLTTRLFIYWTNDNYQTTGCWNLQCPGFVQFDGSVVLGGTFPTLSSFGGTQAEVELTWAKSSATDEWWLLYNGTKWVGYYPRALYTGGMQTQATFTAYGGEVLNSEPGGRHTATVMGSGQFAASWYRWAAYQRFLKYVDTTYTLVDPTPSPGVTNPTCYSMLSGSAPYPWGAYEFFGGPGYSASCP